MIYPIEGYVVQCDLCGEKDVFYENANYKNSLEIDEEFNDWFNESDWVKKDGKVFCKDCIEED